MTEGVVVAIIGLMAIPISLTIGWFVNRKKNIGDLYKSLTESSQSAVDLMQTAMETLSKELNEATEKIEQLGREITELRHQNLLLLRENHSLHAKIDELVNIVNTGEIPAVLDPYIPPDAHGHSPYGPAS